jgi:Skp family chaperone for outer membrane proteins
MNFSKMKKLLIALVGVLLLATVQAQDLEGSIAVLDPNKVLTTTEHANQALEELRSTKEWKEAEEDLQIKFNEYNDIQENLEKEGPTMSEEEIMGAQKRLNSLRQDINFLQQKSQAMYQDFQSLVSNQQFPKFNKIVTELARSKGIKIILQKNAVLLFDENDPLLNLTPEVVELLNQKEE